MAEAKYIGGQRICDLTARERLDEYAEIFTGNVDESVKNWLDEHPEATTSVEDGSLTESKFADALKLKTINNYVTPEMYGAKGDGISDDTDAFNAALSATNKIVVLSGAYLLTDVCNINSKCLISYARSEIIISQQTTAREWFFVATGESRIEGIKFYTKCDGKILGVSDSENVVIKDCVFEAESGHHVKGLLDVYSNNQNTTIERCSFIHRSTASGGVWVRNIWDYITSNVNIVECNFASFSGTDEVFAVWGGAGTVKNVNITNCTFASSATATMAHMISLGLTGITQNVTMSNCSIVNEGATTTIIKCQPTDGGTAKNIKLVNCGIYNEKANTTLARGKCTFNGCYFHTSASVAFGLDDLSHKFPCFSDCVFNSDRQMLSTLGKFYGCTFNFNAEVAEQYHISQYGITLSNCVFNGVNCTGTVFQIIGNTAPVVIDNVKFFGTMSSLFMSVSAENSIKIFNSFFGKKFNVTNANAYGYIANCFSYSDSLGTIGNLNAVNNTFNFSI